MSKLDRIILFKIMIEILALIHFGFFGVMVIVMKAHAKMKDSKDF